MWNLLKYRAVEWVVTAPNPTGNNILASPTLMGENNKDRLDSELIDDFIREVFEIVDASYWDEWRAGKLKASLVDYCRKGMLEELRLETSKRD